MKKGICSILAILTFLAPIQALAVEIPATVEEAGEKAKEFGWEVSNKLPDQVKRIWHEDVVPTTKKVFNILKDEVWPIISNFFKKMFPNAERELEERKPIIKQELEKEKEEIKEELPVVTKDLWQKLKEVLK
jgi:uncharacterized protein (DUF2267 family)